MDKPQRALIVGGGIAGLSAAYYLSKYAEKRHRALSITVIEAEPRWGGKIQTQRTQGFVVEGGPDAFLFSKPWALDLCRELGIADRLRPTNPEQQKTYILQRGSLRLMPNGLTMMLPADLPSLMKTPLLSWSGKLRLLLDFALPAHLLGEEESLRDFLSRRLGVEAYENLIGPLASGIYAGDGVRLSAQATFPYLLDLEAKHGSLLRGAMRLRRERAQQADGPALGSRSAFLAPIGGMQELVEALVERLKTSSVELRVGTAAKNIERKGDGFLVHLDHDASLQANLLVLATPSYIAAELVHKLSDDLAAELSGIEYASSITVSLAYHKQDIPRALDGYGYLIPLNEGRPALACTWTSTKFSDRAPLDQALVRVFFGGAKQDLGLPEDDGRWVALAREELHQTLGVKEAPLFSWVQGWSRAMPQYNIGHIDRLARIDKILAELPGLALAGNSYRGVGIPDTVYSSMQVAEQVLDLLDAKEIGFQERRDRV
jgi:oxygen-dependent protoporphyrinogen oxidase